jgi:hypothetical protein
MNLDRWDLWHQKENEREKDKQTLEESSFGGVPREPRLKPIEVTGRTLLQEALAARRTGRSLARKSETSYAEIPFGPGRSLAMGWQLAGNRGVCGCSGFNGGHEMLVASRGGGTVVGVKFEDLRLAVITGQSRGWNST